MDYKGGGYSCVMVSAIGSKIIYQTPRYPYSTINGWFVLFIQLLHDVGHITVTLTYIIGSIELPF